MTYMYIVRHSQTVGNVEKRLTGRKEYIITNQGKKYIDKLTDRLKYVKFGQAYSSTSRRAIETIEPLAKLNNLKIETDENLCEMYFGIYDGWKWEDVNKANPKIKETQNEINEIAGILKQESTKEVAARMYNYIRDIGIKNDGKTVLISSHGVAIEAFLRKITNEPFIKKREEYSQKNTSVNIVSYDKNEDRFKVLLLNDYSHLNCLIEN